MIEVTTTQADKKLNFRHHSRIVQEYFASLNLTPMFTTQHYENILGDIQKYDNGYFHNQSFGYY